MDHDKHWVEKYRPQTLDDIILDDEIRNYLKDKSDTRRINNILLVGSAGRGKTSLAKIIVKDIMKCDYIYINASAENGIDVIRHKVYNFVRTKTFDGSQKVVILDEGDGITPQGQHALRNLMEEHLDTAAFVITANYGHKIIDPIQSRCQVFSIDYNKKEFKTHIIKILTQKEKVSIKGDTKEFSKYLDGFYPDFRRALNTIQSRLNGNKLIIKDCLEIENEFYKNVWDKIHHSDVVKLRKYIITNESVFQSDYYLFLKNLMEYTYGQQDEPQMVDILIEIGEAIRLHSIVVDAEINAITAIIKIKKILSN